MDENPIVKGVITPWRIQMFKLTEECQNCGGPMLFGFPHMCRPVGERRIREIIAEEVQRAAVVSNAVSAQQQREAAEMLREYLEQQEPEAESARRAPAKKTTGKSRPRK